MILPLAVREKSWIHAFPKDITAKENTDRIVLDFNSVPPVFFLRQ